MKKLLSRVFLSLVLFFSSASVVLADIAPVYDPRIDNKSNRYDYPGATEPTITFVDALIIGASVVALIILSFALVYAIRKHNSPK